MLSDKIIKYYRNLKFDGTLPDDITMMNPVKESKIIAKICKEFYSKYYNDNNKRFLILGINPGRLGAGSTGIPFTDTKRLIEKCNINIEGVHTHEPSSVFIYDMIDAFGGPEKFYSKFYINSVCPLGFTISNESKKEINYNYYDDRKLQDTVLDFIKWNITTQIKLGCHTSKVFCLGTGKNYKFLNELNNKEKYFGQVIPLDHPRFIMQYKLKFKDIYIENYINEFEKT
jgi:hypothetical protein